MIKGEVRTLVVEPKHGLRSGDIVTLRKPITGKWKRLWLRVTFRKPYIQIDGKVLRTEPTRIKVIVL